MAASVNVGLIGHCFMGRVHSHALRDLPAFFDPGVEPSMQVLCGIGEGLEETAARFGWARHTTSWEEVVGDPDIDLVVLCVPDNLHAEMAIRCIEGGKHVLCEKPLATTASEAHAMASAAARGGLAHMTGFNNRFAPAVRLAKDLIDGGRIGEVLHFKGVYQQEWFLDPSLTFIWRMDSAVAGEAGVVGDKGAHIIDLARYLVGDIDEVSAMTMLAVEEIPATDGRVHRADVPDAAAFLARFENGALGIFHASSLCSGYTYCRMFEVNGSRGTIRYHVERLNELKVSFADEEPRSMGFRTVSATRLGVHPYADNWWGDGFVLGWEHTVVHELYELLGAIARSDVPSPSFVDGLRAQEVIEAVIASARERRTIPVERRAP